MTVTIKINKRSQGKVLSDYAKSWNRVELIMGPLGSGKTIESCQKILNVMINQAPNKQGVRPTRCFAIRNTYPDLTSTTIKDWIGLFSELGRYTQGGIELPTHYLDFNLPDGTSVSSELKFLALDRPDAIKKLRGVQATCFWLNEVKELPKAVVDMADLRHGRYPSMATGGVNCDWHGMVGDTNAPDDDHWYYELAENIKPKGWRFHKQPGGLIRAGEEYRINPKAENLKNLPSGYYINGMEGKRKDWINVNLCNEYGSVQSGKPVYPEYNDSIHALQSEYLPDRNLPIILGHDFGRTPATAFLQYLPAYGRYIGFDEFVCEDMSAAIFAPELKKYIDRTYQGFTFSVGNGDPSGEAKGQATEDTPFKLLNANGIKTAPAYTNSPLVRRSSVVTLLKELCMDGRPAFMISPKCKVWRKGLNGGFKYKRVLVAGDERYHDEPDKNKYSHICEAGEYGLMANGEGRKALKTKDASFNKPVQAKVNFNVFD